MIIEHRLGDLTLKGADSCARDVCKTVLSFLDQSGLCSAVEAYAWTSLRLACCAIALARYWTAPFALEGLIGRPRLAFRAKDANDLAHAILPSQSTVPSNLNIDQTLYKTAIIR